MRALRPWSLHILKALRPTWHLLAPGIAVLWLSLVAVPGAAQHEPAPPADASGDQATSPDDTALASPVPTMDTQTILSPGGLEALERAWFTPAYGLPERAQQLRGAADRIGVESLDAAARAVLLGKMGADRREEAEAAVLLAPDLPLGHAALAEVRWRERDTWGALRAAGSALSRAGVHLEARLWTQATAGWFLFVALLGGGFGYVALRGATALPLAARDLGEWFEHEMSTPARWAMVASLVLVPPALGEGPVGALAVLFLLALLYASKSERRVLLAAAALAFAALGPLAQGVGRAFVSFGADPLAEAAWSSERGFLDPVESERLRDRGERHPLAMHAIARRARRAGAHEAAEARFLALVNAEPDNPVLLNDLGNLRYRQGDLDEATRLYRSAAQGLQSAVIWFNLAQAHGKNIEIDEHEDALAVAQELDGELIGRLAQRIGGSEEGVVIDLPLSNADFRNRMMGGSGSAFADQTRRALAPGWLGAHPSAGAGLFFVLTVIVGMWRRRVALSHWCYRCASITSGLVAVESANEALCDACRQTHGRRQVGWKTNTEPTPRWSRALRVALTLCGAVLPGVGLTMTRPLAAWIGLCGAILAVSVWWLGSTRIPDPLAMGAAAAWVKMILGGVGALFFAASFVAHLRSGAR